MDSFSSRAYQAMFPDLETNLNLTNFIVELVDISSLVKMVGRWWGRIRRRDWTDFSSKDVAEAHLTGAFAVIPFIGDCKKLYDNLKHFDERIRDFKQRSLKQQKRYYREAGEWVGSEESLVESYESVWFNSTQTRVNKYSTMTYSYTCPELDSFSQKVKVFRDMMGLRLSLHNVWEAIPFSFVVDWFVRVGDFLRQFQKPLIEVDLEIVDFTLTSKTEWDLHQWVNLQVSNGSFKNVDTYKNRGKLYVRRRTQPNVVGYSNLTAGQFGLRQLALSGSLLRVRS